MKQERTQTTQHTHHKKLTFIENKVPGLKAKGEYTLTLKQSVSGTNISDKEGQYNSSKTFVVKAPRFTLDPAVRHSVFPPNNNQGDFTNCFPHIVLNRPMLPWVREIGGGHEATSWMALLLFDEDEAADLSYSKSTVEHLIPKGSKITVLGNSTENGKGKLPASGYVSYPFNAPVSGSPYQLGYGETPKDPCHIIDIPSDTFNSIMPNIEDIKYLAHIRQVDTSEKTGSGNASEFSLVVGNRIPQAQGKSIVHLVSLEGMSPYLPDDKYNSQLPSDTQYVRLVSLYRWEFSVLAEKQSFKALLENLNTTTNNTGTTLQTPTGKTPPSSTEVKQALSNQASGSLTADNADVLVRNALSMGYTGLNHHLRHGGNTVSWYHGPLLPYTSIKESSGLSFPLSCADAATRYNPETGLFDTSYSAAWQIGQLLALQNKSFSIALYQWKCSVLQTLAMSVEKAAIDETFEQIHTLLNGIEKDQTDHKTALIELISHQLKLLNT